MIERFIKLQRISKKVFIIIIKATTDEQQIQIIIQTNKRNPNSE